MKRKPKNKEIGCESTFYTIEIVGTGAEHTPSIHISLELQWLDPGMRGWFEGYTCVVVVKEAMQQV